MKVVKKKKKEHTIMGKRIKNGLSGDPMGDKRWEKTYEQGEPVGMGLLY